MHWRIRALAAAGRTIILHYFNYRPNRSASDLEPYCQGIYSYKRKGPLAAILSKQPYIVSSRIHPQLVNRLNEDDAPVLLEGLHTTGILPMLTPGRKVLVRMHNHEADYYQRLSLTEKKRVKKTYLQMESRRIEQYCRLLPKDLAIACISQDDSRLLKEDYGLRSVRTIPPFLPWQQIGTIEGSGDYCLYHGNLEVSENEAAAAWLATEVFSKIPVKLIIAGRRIGSPLRAIARNIPNLMLVDSPAEDELNGLIRNAHINVLPSHNRTGVKLKLLHAAFEGRYCITNGNGLAGMDASPDILCCETAAEWIDAISMLMTGPFTADQIKNRQQLLTVYDNMLNAQKISALL